MNPISDHRVADYLRLFRPDAKQVSAMVGWLRAAKGWSWARLALYTRIGRSDLHAMAEGRVRPLQWQIAAIWWLYCLDVCPTKLTNEVFLMTWGRGTDLDMLPKPMPAGKEVSDGAMKFILGAREAGASLTNRQVMEKIVEQTGFRYTDKGITKLCRRYGLKLAPQKRGRPASKQEQQTKEKTE